MSSDGDKGAGISANALSDILSLGIFRFPFFPLAFGSRSVSPPPSRWRRLAKLVLVMCALISFAAGPDRLDVPVVFRKIKSEHSIFYVIEQLDRVDLVPKTKRGVAA